MGAQRLGCYSKMAGPPADGDDGGGGGWTSGRLGFGTSSREARRQRRRLAKSSKGDDGGTSSTLAGINGTAAADFDPIAEMLMYAMYDTMLTVLFFAGIIVSVHYVLLLYWQCCANRRYYAWVPPDVPTNTANRRSMERKEMESTKCVTAQAIMESDSALGELPSQAAYQAARLQSAIRRQVARRRTKQMRAEIAEAEGTRLAAERLQRAYRGRKFRRAWVVLLQHMERERLARCIQRSWRKRHVTSSGQVQTRIRRIMPGQQPMIARGQQPRWARDRVGMSPPSVPASPPMSPCTLDLVEPINSPLTTPRRPLLDDLCVEPVSFSATPGSSHSVQVLVRQASVPPQHRRMPAPFQDESGEEITEAMELVTETTSTSITVITTSTTRVRPFRPVRVAPEPVDLPVQDRRPKEKAGQGPESVMEGCASNERRQPPKLRSEFRFAPWNCLCSHMRRETQRQRHLRKAANAVAKARQAATRPQFRPLPAILRFPTLEKFVLISFSPALMTTASSVIGAQIGGYHVLEGWSLSLAFLIIIVVVRFFVSEISTLIRFRRVHHDACWQGAEPPQSIAEVDDPIFASLARLRVMRSRLRCRGGFEPPDEDSEEPTRTERALSRAFSCSLWRYCGGQRERAGDVLETLPMWTDDASCGIGIYYVITQGVLQLCIAVLMGALYSSPYSGNASVILTLIGFQVLLCIWLAIPTGNDVFGEFDSFMGYFSELLSTCLILASNRVAASAGDDAEKLALSLNLAGLSAKVMVWSCFVPLILTAYDSFLVPVVMIFWKSELSFRETLCQALLSCILLPLTIAGAFLGFSGGHTEALMQEMESQLVVFAAEGDGGSGDDQTGSGKEDEGERSETVEARLAADDAKLAAAIAAMAAAAAAAAAATDRPTQAKPSNAALKRKRREEMLARVRAAARAASVTAGNTRTVHARRDFRQAAMNAQRMEQRAELAKVFSQFDKDGSGDVSSAEMAKICEELGLSKTPEQLNELIRECDPECAFGSL